MHKESNVLGEQGGAGPLEGCYQDAPVAGWADIPCSKVELTPSYWNSKAEGLEKP